MEDQNLSRGQKELQTLVQQAHLCTGCGACVGLCPYQVVYNDQTIVLHQCDLKEGRCYAFCPRTPTDYDFLRKSLFEVTDLTAELGPVKGFYITRAADPDLRRNAQHGGTVTALMALALEEGWIDSAIVAEDEEDFQHHGLVVDKPEEIVKRGKSKFLVSPTVAAFNKAVQGEAQKIGVVATPCQAQALAKMRMKPIAGNDNQVDKLKLIIGLFCGWTLSWRPFTDLLRTKTELSNILGMDIPPGKGVVEIYTTKGTLTFTMEELQPYIREGCRYCVDSTAEFADISVGSARLPEDWAETKTWNQILVRSLRGQELIELARSKGILEFRDVPPGNLEELKQAAREKKKGALERIKEKGRGTGKVLYA
ncbi:MAG: Coenzyme F420 hydrogenase/dehydrogenase, beta subunit C-terminal domain [Thermodesulfobacteriota bacterium]